MSDSHSPVHSEYRFHRRRNSATSPNLSVHSSYRRLAHISSHDSIHNMTGKDNDDEIELLQNMEDFGLHHHPFHNDTRMETDAERSTSPVTEWIPLQTRQSISDAILNVVPTLSSHVPNRFKKTQKRNNKKYRRGEDQHRTIYPFQPDDSFAPNVIQNQKYTIFTFLPIVLFEQFKFFFNLYFLLVALSQFIKALQIGYLFTYVGPLSFVLVVIMSKEALDDYHRYKRDQEANSQRYQVFREGRFISLPSSKLCVGDVISIERNMRVPADCVLLSTTDPSGTCFIRTDQLDGETDWKLRIAVHTSQKFKSIYALSEESASVYGILTRGSLSSEENNGNLIANDFSVDTLVDAPSKDIHQFVGKITWINDSETLVDSLSVENTLWMNTVVASGTAIALIVYTGSDTRAVMNTSFPSTKVGLLDLEINRLSKILAVVTVTLSLVMVGLDGFRGNWYIYAFRFLILFSSIIPISLRVNLDMGKTLYSYQMMNDHQIPSTIVRTSTIPEELGRIDYLLSDKTGTLTKNDMEMKRLHMGTISYDADSMEDLAQRLSAAFASQADQGDTFFKRARNISDRVKDIVVALALCHNVTPTQEEGESITFQASSPDEIAIVKWTQSVGLTLVFRDISNMKLETSNGALLEYHILDIFPFTSETKRMGIILRDVQTNELMFLQKGADVVMSKIVSYNDWLEEECGNMAREGLRTLVIGKKKLSDDYYLAFKKQYMEAKASLVDRNQAIQNVISRFLEKDLELLGLTGVEDKLQDDVKLTLEQLRNAGLKIWMLTGDKIETATCIAVSSRLVSRHQTIHTIAKMTDPSSIMDELDLLSTKQDCCLVIDGESLNVCLRHHPKEFIRVASSLPAVVCCRCSPTQKADITYLLKTHTTKRICAIGDGGNDVNMIQTAHVGIGLVGKEGKQASLAADFSITQFSFVSRLLLWHGRNSYQRSAKLAQFVIHRGLIISIMQAVFSALFYYAPIAIYQGMLVVGYATLYTMAPVFSLVLDRDISDETALLYPELYKELTKGRSLTFKTFLIWLLISVYQGGMLMLLAIWLFEKEFMRIVSISFTALILNELLMVALQITTWHRYMLYSQVITFVVYCSSMWILPTYFDINFILSWGFIWKVAFITAVSCVPLYITKTIQLRIRPPAYTKLEG